MFITMYGEDDPVAQGVLHELLAKGADVNAEDANGKTAENWATDYKHERVTELLRSLKESRSKDH